MQLSTKELQDFPHRVFPPVSVCLIYGENSGSINAYLKHIKTLLFSQKSLTEEGCIVLEAQEVLENPNLLSDAVATPHFFCSQSLVYILQASDKLTALLKQLLPVLHKHVLIVLTSGPLTPQSSLRSLCEKDKKALSIPCYFETEKTTLALIQSSKIGLSRPLSLYLTHTVPKDRARITHVITQIDTYGAQSIKEEDFHIFMPDCLDPLDHDIDLLLTGEIPLKTSIDVTDFSLWLHILYKNLEQLYTVLSSSHPEETVQQLSPPIFFKKMPFFKAQMKKWNKTMITLLIEKVIFIDLQHRKGHMPKDVAYLEILRYVTDALRNQKVAEPISIR